MDADVVVEGAQIVPVSKATVMGVWFFNISTMLLILVLPVNVSAFDVGGSFALLLRTACSIERVIAVPIKIQDLKLVTVL